MPVVLSHVDCRVPVNALTDDACMTGYLNLGVAAHLGLQGKPHKAVVSALSGNVSTFTAAPVKFTIGSIDGSVSQRITA